MRFYHCWLRRWHHHHHKRAPASVSVSVEFIINLGDMTVQVNLTWTTPILRADGTTALDLTEIKQVNINRNGEQLTTLAPVAGSMAYSDTSPLTGSDSYDVEYVDTAGFVSKPSNTATVTVAAANPPAAVTDLTATLITP